MKEKKKDNNSILWILAGAALLLSFSKGSKNKINSRFYNISDVQKSNVAVTQGFAEQFGALSPEIIANVNYFIKNLLDPLSTLLGQKLSIDSWWRSLRLNEFVGGVPGSFHTLGLSIDADLIENGAVNNKKLIKTLLESGLPFTELILYGSISKPTQIHLALSPQDPTQNEIFLKVGSDYQPLSKEDLLNYYTNVTA